MYPHFSIRLARYRLFIACRFDIWTNSVTIPAKQFALGRYVRKISGSAQYFVIISKYLYYNYL